VDSAAILLFMTQQENTAAKDDNMKTLTSKGFEYRGIILDGMVKNFGHDVTVTMMEHKELCGLINCTAQKAADAKTAEMAAAIAATVLGCIARNLAAL